MLLFHNETIMEKLCNRLLAYWVKCHCCTRHSRLKYTIDIRCIFGCGIWVRGPKTSFAGGFAASPKFHPLLVCFSQMFHNRFFWGVYFFITDSFFSKTAFKMGPFHRFHQISPFTFPEKRRKIVDFMYIFRCNFHS